MRNTLVDGFKMLRTESMNNEHEPIQDAEKLGPSRTIWVKG